MNKNPPLIARFLLRKFLPVHDRDYLIGDFEESYNVILMENNIVIAWLWYWRQVFISSGSFYGYSFIRSTNMFKNYSKTAIRNLKRSKLYSSINIIGLSIGIACSILIFFFVQHEYSYDRFHNEAENIFNIQLNMRIGDQEFSTTPQGTLAPNMARDFPEVQSFIRMREEDLVIKINNNTFLESLVYTDKNMFQFFNFKMITGNPENVFENPYSVVITTEFAKKHFGNIIPLGKRIEINLENEYKNYTITGISENIPSNSSIKFQIAVNFDSNTLRNMENWDKAKRYTTLIRLLNKNNSNELIEKVNNTYERYKNKTESEDKPRSQYLDITSLVDIHLYENVNIDILDGKSSTKNSYILSGIALLILLTACFNFMNLTIGSSASRIKEIGMRKVLGAHGRQLKRQFLFESLIISFIAFCLGLLLAKLALPGFNGLAGREITLNYIGNLQALGFFVFLIFSSAILAGLYPSLKFSNYQSVDIFREKINIGGTSLFTRSLIISQFSIAIFLITSTYIMNKQQNLLLNTDLGFRKDLMMVVQIHRNSGDNSIIPGPIIQAIKNDLLQNTNILNITATSANLTKRISGAAFEDEKGKTIILSILNTDKDFLDTYKIDLVEGEDFSFDDLSGNTIQLLVNEKFIKDFSVKDPIGKKFKDLIPAVSVREKRERKITGVVKDFHYGNLKSSINPLIIENNVKATSYLHLQIKGTDVIGTVNKVRDAVKSALPNQPFVYSFLDEDIANQYIDEERWGNIISLSSLLAVVIACSGLFGLTLMTITRRKKEISIRKVLGSSTAGIARLINREFLILVVISNIIAWPAAFFIMEKWLQGFVTRIEPGIEIFLTAGIIVVLIAFITVSFNTINAGLSNPIESLRNE